ncbi:D-alanyl-D-alanine carboxypeptidase [bacterium]|nr:D-alanyl-D-alanine carboxypeptidase [bacterium]
MLFATLTTIFFLISSPLLHQAVFWDNLIKNNDSFPDSFYSLGPQLTAKSALIVDFDSGDILFEKDSTKILPIASITKLMTALVFLEKNTKEWDEKIVVSEEDLIKWSNKGGGEIQPAQLSIRVGDELNIKDVFNSGLIKSANNASKILARLIPTCCGQTFSDLMNKKARSLGMTDTYFVEPTGLSPVNRSNAQDLSKLIKAAFNQEEIREALSYQTYDIKFKRNGLFYRQRLYNTDKLLNSFIDIKGAKTGYLEESGYCLAGISDYSGRKLIVIILGANTDENRFQEAKSLIWWVARQDQLKKEANVARN